MEQSAPVMTKSQPPVENTKGLKVESWNLGFRVQGLGIGFGKLLLVVWLLLLFSAILLGLGDGSM